MKITAEAIFAHAAAQDVQRAKALRRRLREATINCSRLWGAPPAMAVAALRAVANEIESLNENGRLVWPPASAAKYRPGASNQEVIAAGTEAAAQLWSAGITPSVRAVLRLIRKRGVRRRDSEAQANLAAVVAPYFARAATVAYNESKAVPKGLGRRFDQ